MVEDTDARDALLHALAPKIGNMSTADLARLIADALKAEREQIMAALRAEHERMARRLDYLQRQLSMLRSNDRARSARELHAATMAEDADDD